MKFQVLRHGFGSLGFKSCVGALLFALPLLSPAAHADFQDVNLGTAGPSGLNLGIFVTGPTSMNASNSGTLFSTNLGLANGASTNFSGGGTLTGTLYADPGATIQNNINSQFNINGGITTQSLAQAVTDVQNASTAAAGLTANQTFSSLGSSPVTINASGSANSLGGLDTVVNVTGNIAVTNPSNNLTIHGGPNDFFIIDVHGNISVTNGEITTSGGIPSSHILFNLVGSNNSVSESNSTSVLTGTYLAPFSGQKITISPGTVNGALIGYQISTSSGPKVNGIPYIPPVPEPASMALMGIGLSVFGLRQWISRRPRPV